jgi:adenylate cyclase class 2
VATSGSGQVNLHVIANSPAMFELEAKYRSKDNGKVEEALTGLGAQKLSEGVIEDLYFSHRERDFGDSDEVLRIRRTEGAAELTYKGPRMRRDDAKAREEISVKVGDGFAAQRIIERLGFEQTYVMKKRRTSYILDKVRVELDDVEGLGQYVELELLTEAPERAGELLEIARKRLPLGEPEPRTYLEMQIEKLGESAGEAERV